MDKILSILEPLFKYIDGGKMFKQPFKVLYYVFGVLTCLGCLYFITQVFDMVKALNGGAYVWAILMLVVLLAAGVFSLIYWFKRAKLVGCDIPENTRFLAIPAVAGLTITFGEWMGLVVMFVGGLWGLLFAILMPITGNGADAFLVGLAITAGSIIGGYLTIIFFRLLGEQILAIGAIANDTSVIAKNTKK